MERLKELNRLTAPDSRHEAFVVLDRSAPDGTRQLTEADRHGAVAVLELPESVPDTIRSAFAVTRTLWLYGWYYWPFYTLASFHAVLCLDMALAIRVAHEDNIKDRRRRTPSLPVMLKRAIESGWVTDEGIAHARRLREKSAWMRDEFPEDLFGASPDPWEVSPHRYCRILLETLPNLRNEFAHPKHYWHDLPSSLLLVIENVHGLIRQLFPDKQACK